MQIPALLAAFALAAGEPHDPAHAMHMEHCRACEAACRACQQACEALLERESKNIAETEWEGASV